MQEIDEILNEINQEIKSQKGHRNTARILMKQVRVLGGKNGNGRR